MKPLKWLAIVLWAYFLLVVAFEGLVGFMGSRQAKSGVGPDEQWIVLTTRDAQGAPRDTVLAGMDIDGKLYVATNHWARAWYGRALALPDVELTRAGERSARRAVEVGGEERAHVAQVYSLHWVLRVLTGFPPRQFLRLDPR